MTNQLSEVRESLELAINVLIDVSNGRKTIDPFSAPSDDAPDFVIAKALGRAMNLVEGME